MRFGVTVIYKESAYVEVEADDEDDAMDKAQEAVDSNDPNVKPVGSQYDDDIDYEVEKLDD